MGKWWSLLFAAMMLFCVGTFLVAPLMGWWLPDGLSTHSGSVDYLFNFILVITTFFFIVTEAVLCIFMCVYSGDRDKTLAPTPPGRVANMFSPLTKHLNEHTVEIVWTIIPAALLLFIAIYQVNTWTRIKYISRMPTLEQDKMPVQVGVSARQFEWRIRYPSAQRFQEWLKGKELIRQTENSAAFAKLPQESQKDIKAQIEKFEKDFHSFPKYEQKDDIHGVNELHVIMENPTVVHLSTRDVIHSFNLPHLRVKQDALPGKMIPVWFTPTKSNVALYKSTYVDGVGPEGITRDAETRERKIDERYIWDLPCAELCGWGHYRMVGRLYVHKDATEFLDWLKKADAYMNSHERDIIASK